MKRFMRLALALAVFAIAAQAAFAATQGQVIGAWSDVGANNANYTPRSRSASAVANNILWVIGGQDTTSSKTPLASVEGYDPSANAWIKADNMPVATKGAAAVAVNGKIYVIGGTTSSGKTGNTYVFDPSAPAGSQWTSKATKPIVVDAPVAVLVDIDPLNPKIQVYTGDAGNYPNDHAYESYDINADKWSIVGYQYASTKQLLAPTANREAQGVAAKDITTGQLYVYLISGWTGAEGETKEVWRTAPATQYSTGWDSHIHVMTEGRYLGTAVVITASDPSGNSVEYPLVVGGYTNKFSGNPATRSLLLYISGKTNGWLSGSTNVGPDLPQARTDRPAVGVLNVGGANYLYVAGGSNGNNTTPVTAVVRAPINSNNYPPTPATEPKIISQWEDAGANMPTGRVDPVSGVVNGKLYVIGGSTSDYNSKTPTMLGANEMYDPIANSWSTMAAMPVPVKGAAAAVINGKIYIAGGQSAANRYENALQVYDPQSDTWTTSRDTGTTLPPLPVAVSNTTGVATADGKFHVIGGTTTGNTGTNKHQVYDPATNTWADLSSTLGPSWSMWNSLATEVTTYSAGKVAWDWIYYATGNMGTGQVSNAIRYNGNPGGAYGDKWYGVANVPVGGVNRGAMAAITDSAGTPRPVFMGGAHAPIPAYDRVFVYHDSGEAQFKNTWLEDIPMPSNRAGRPVLCQIGSYVYVTAGATADVNGNFNLNKSVWRAFTGSTAPVDVTTIGGALHKSNGTTVNITTAKVVTRVYQTANGVRYFWIEEDDRGSAVRVGPATVPVAQGNQVTLSGKLSIDSATGQRTIVPTTMTVDPAIYAIPQPVVLSNKAFAGGSSVDQPGRRGGIGLNNMGMLVRIYGKVNVDTSGYYGYDSKMYFYIDDGSALKDGTDLIGDPFVGIRIYSQLGWGMVNDYIVATGIVSSEIADGITIPILLCDDILTGDPNGYYAVAR